MANELFQFTIIDYTTNPLGDSTIIEEPAGWDGVEFEHIRTENHGFLDSINIDNIDFLFIGDAYNILLAAFEDYGLEAMVELQIEYRVNPSDAFVLMYLGNFKFSTYKKLCGLKCGIICGVSQQGCYYQFHNRKNQRVNTSSLVSKDGTALSAYTWLNKEIPIKPKEIEYRYSGSTPAGTSFNSSPSGLQDLTSFLYGVPCDDEFFAVLPVTNLTATEIEDPYNGGAIVNALNFTGNDINFRLPDGKFIEVGLFPNLNFVDLRNIGCSNDFELTLDIDIDATMSCDLTQQMRHNPLVATPIYRLVVMQGSAVDFAPLAGGSSNKALLLASTANTTLGNFQTTTNNFVLSTTISNIDLRNGDYLIWGLELGNIVAASGFTPTQYYMSIDINTYNFTLTNRNTCDTTNAEVSLINETLSRVVENYTNDCIRVKSDYFGRTDSEPYTSASDGCGSLESLSSGLQIRGAYDESGALFKLNVDFESTFKSLSAIHNLGYGLEPDSVRGGTYQWLRIEQYDYFYDTSILFVLDKPNIVTQSQSANKVYSKISLGYKNWSTIEDGGNQDVFAKREYSTNLSRINNEKEILCDFVASDFALEVTRRMYGLTKKDWTYDNNSFIICLVRDGSSYEVETFTGVISNYVYSPDTMKNLRITPLRNLIRHIPILTTFIKPNLTYELTFNFGEANFIANAIPNAPDACFPRLIANNDEDANISQGDVYNTEYELPILNDTEVSFEYPFCNAQYLTYKANPYGLIGFSCPDGTIVYGWVLQLNYNPSRGKAQIKLTNKQP